jgi:hypothetical protein
VASLRQCSFSYRPVLTSDLGEVGVACIALAQAGDELLGFAFAVSGDFLLAMVGCRTKKSKLGWSLLFICLV